MSETTTVLFNPKCSKCRAARELLEARGVEAEYRLYLESPPGVDELREILEKLGSDDPRTMMRTGEAVYSELGLADADADARLSAMVEHPILIQRPIVIRGQRAVVARPPELLLELVD